MSDNIFSNARRAYDKSDFVKAKYLYEQAGEKFGNNLVKYNLELCKNKLAASYTNDSSNSGVNEYFDHVYMVNLKEKVGNRLKVATHLNNFGISFEVFEATNGYKGEALERFERYKSRELGQLTRYPEFNDFEKQRGKGFIESAGSIGYIYTYLKIIRDAKSRGYKRILIVEDDVLLSNDFEYQFRGFVDRIARDWKVLMLGASQYNWSSVNEAQAIDQGYYFPRQLHTCGSFAMALNASIFDELIEAEEAFEAPFDHLPLGEIYERYMGKCFVAYPNIIMPDVSESSIRGERCQVNHSKNMKWLVTTFDYPLSRPSINVLVESKNSLRYLSFFRPQNQRPFNLRLFFNTGDGPRPLHNSELMDYECNKTMPVDDFLTLPDADFSAQLPSNKVLTEDDIVKYIIFCTGVAEPNDSGLKKLVCFHPKVKKGRVTIVIPTYKRPSNLVNALRSVATQEYIDKEIIVVSDNGKDTYFNDETSKIVNLIQEDFPDVEIKLLFHKSNRNGAAARNTGLLASTGEYVCYLDDDDIYLPGRLDKSIQVLSHQPKSVGGVYGGFLGWNSPENDLNRYAIGDLTKEILLLEYTKHYLHTNTATYRRNTVFDINGFDETYRRHQDLEFNLRFFELFIIEAVKEPMVRLNPEPSEVSNKAFNIEMLNLKLKFLTQFSSTIKKLSLEDQTSIHSLHHNEAIKYINNKEHVIDYYKNQLHDYSAQMVIKLLGITEGKNVSASYTQAESLQDGSSREQLTKSLNIGGFGVLSDVLLVDFLAESDGTCPVGYNYTESALLRSRWGLGGLIESLFSEKIPLNSISLKYCLLGIYETSHNEVIPKPTRHDFVRNARVSGYLGPEYEKIVDQFVQWYVEFLENSGGNDTSTNRENIIYRIKQFMDSVVMLSRVKAQNFSSISVFRNDPAVFGIENLEVYVYDYQLIIIRDPLDMAIEWTSSHGYEYNVDNIAKFIKQYNIKSKSFLDGYERLKKDIKKSIIIIEFEKLVESLAYRKKLIDRLGINYPKNLKKFRSNIYKESIGRGKELPQNLQNEIERECSEYYSMFLSLI